jgi:hypothetical protein
LFCIYGTATTRQYLHIYASPTIFRDSSSEIKGDYTYKSMAAKGEKGKIASAPSNPMREHKERGFSWNPETFFTTCIEEAGVTSSKEVATMVPSRSRQRSPPTETISKSQHK